MSDELKHTRLHDWHIEHGARMVDFAGWEMPIQYASGPLEEHHLTRRSAGLFDIDHMGQFTVSGPGADEYLNRLVTWDIRSMQPNDAHYTLMCYEHGGVVDDLFLYLLPDQTWFIVVNAANRAKDYEWMSSHAEGYEVSLEDISDTTYMLALQGPKAIDLLSHLTDSDVPGIPRFTMINANVAGIETMIGRTGYTGEDGVELFFPSKQAITMWNAILDKGTEVGIEAGPIGLAARDSLRFEPCFALYGHEIDADTNPVEARLSWVCDWNHDFVGKEAILRAKESGVKKSLIAFELTERGVPREGYTVANEEGDPIGTVVTGMYAPTVDKYAGHAFVDPKFARIGTPIQIIIREKPKAAVVVKRPFYTPAYR